MFRQLCIHDAKSIPDIYFCMRDDEDWISGRIIKVTESSDRLNMVFDLETLNYDNISSYYECIFISLKEILNELVD